MRIVVGAAIVRDGRVLAQQRGYPPEVAGQWELPGGRVEPGESEADALHRECVEELGVEVIVGARIGPDIPTDTGYLLRVYACTLHHSDAAPEALDHAALRWLTAADLDTVPWLAADLALLPALHATLTTPSPYTPAPEPPSPR